MGKRDLGRVTGKQRSFTRFQEKILSADVTSDGVIAELTFSNLKAGKFYRYSYQLNFHTNSSDGLIRVVIDNGTTEIGRSSRQASSTGTTDNIWSLCALFRAVDSILTIETASASVNAFLEGNGTRVNGSFAQIEELPDHVEVTDFN